MHEPPYRVKNMMPGMIMGWPWSIDTIPSGWHLCDGTMGTPDYRNCFLVGAGDQYAPGDNDANPVHEHDFTGDGHDHWIMDGTGIQSGMDLPVLTTTDPAAGTTDPVLAKPPYHAINWIMKL